MISLTLIVLTTGCDETVVTDLPTCDLAGVVEPATGEPGDAIVITLGPVLDQYDTLVQVGGTNANVTDVDRDNCSACDACREFHECLSCDSCVICSEDCNLCVETVTFAVPELAAQSTSIVVISAFGSTEPIPFSVLPTDTSDTGGGDR